MASDWIRWNDTSKVFQRTVDFGSNWTTLKIAAEGVDVAPLPANLAYTNVLNTFTKRQLVSGAGAVSGTDYAGAPIEIATANPRISFHWPSVAASQIGVAPDGAIRTYDNPGTGYAPFAAANITALGNIHNNGGYVYPGRADASGIAQSSWYLCSHATYGLYTNTGLYVTSGVWCNFVEATAHIRATTGLYAGANAYITGAVYASSGYYEFNRATPMGHYETVPSANMVHGQLTGVSGTIAWSLIGKTMILMLQVTGTTAGAVGSINISLPGNLVPAHSTHVPITLYTPDRGWHYGFISMTAGVYYITVWNDAQAAMSGGVNIFVVFPMGIA